MSRDRIIQLQENAEELGFGTIQEALDNGYNEVQDLVNGTFRLEKVDEQEKAHEAWLKEKACALEGLEDLRKRIPYDWAETIDVLDRAIKFIKEAHD